MLFFCHAEVTGTDMVPLIEAGKPGSQMGLEIYSAEASFPDKLEKPFYWIRQMAVGSALRDVDLGTIPRPVIFSLYLVSSHR